MNESEDGARRARVDELNAQAQAVRRTDYEQLRELSEEALELAGREDGEAGQYHLGMATSLSHLAHRSCMLGELDLTLALTARALALLDPMPADAVRCDLLETLGWTHFYLGDIAEALDHLLQALKVADEIDDHSLRAYVLDGIANVHSASDHPDLAYEAQEQALKLHRELDDRDGEAVTLNNMVYTLLDLEDCDSALAAAQTTLRIAEEEGRRYLRMAALDTLAHVYLEMGELRAAEECAQQSLALAREYCAEPDEVRCMLSLGRIACLRGAYDEALPALQQALATAERLDVFERVECHELLAEAHEGRREFEAALAHYKRFHTLRQTRINDETVSRLANLKLTHQVETATKDAEIHRLRSLALEREIEEQRVMQVMLEARASLDPLTGLYNRGHFAVLEDDLRAAARESRPVALMMCDIDRFKEINDSFGHAAGDRVIVALAQQLRESGRKSDVPCRYGGDEFMVLLVDVDAEAALGVGERLRVAVAAAPISCGSHEIAVTISVGLATAAEQAEPCLDDLIERADGALYAAKQAGRDRVVVVDQRRG